MSKSARKMLETFRPVGTYELNALKQDEPSCFNGMVRIHRYRITIDEIAESHDVLCARLQKLWDECDNYHYVGPLRAAAKKLGYDLVGSYGGQKP